MTKDLCFRLGLCVVDICCYVRGLVLLNFQWHGVYVRQCLSEMYINLAKLIVCFGLAKHFTVKICCHMYLYNGKG